METFKFKRKYALTIFILILLLGELSERDLKTEEKPEKEILYIEDDRVFARSGFFDFSREEREIMLYNTHKKLYN